MRRFEVMDGMRGYFLVFMLINHLIFTGGFWLVEINHRQLAFVEDAQGFVFLSGFLVGLVYGRRMLREGYEAGRNKVWRRAFELYRYAMGVVIVILAVRWFSGDQGLWQNWLGDTNLADSKRMLAVATLVFQPTFMDILPQYILYMLFAPLLIHLCLKGQWGHVLIGSGLVWMSAQLGLHRLVTEPLNALALGGDEQGLRAAFNILGWQIVFNSALVFGVLTANRSIDWGEIFSPEKTFLPKAALAICLFFLPLRIMTAHGLMPGFVLGKFATMEQRGDFGPVYLLNFAAVAAAFAWLILAGPEHRSKWVRRLASGATWLFTLPFLQLLGRHSLQVYAWHVLIIYFVNYLDSQAPDMSQLSKTAIAALGIALLALPPLLREVQAKLSQNSTS